MLDYTDFRCAIVALCLFPVVHEVKSYNTIIALLRFTSIIIWMVPIFMMVYKEVNKVLHVLVPCEKILFFDYFIINISSII